MKVRLARHTERLEEVVGWYRDRLGLPELGRFADHDGYDGVFLDLPGTGTQLEFTGGGGVGAPPPHPESLLVIYCADDAERAALARRIGTAPVQPENPYWRRHGLAFADPDGFQVVLAVER